MPELGEGFVPFGWYAGIGYVDLAEAIVVDRLDAIEARAQGALPERLADRYKQLLGSDLPWLLKIARAAQQISQQDPREFRLDDSTNVVWISCSFCTAQVIDHDTNDLLHDSDCPWLLLHEAFKEDVDAEPKRS